MKVSFFTYAFTENALLFQKPLVLDKNFSANYDIICQPKPIKPVYKDLIHCFVTSANHPKSYVSRWKNVKMGGFMEDRSIYDPML